MPQPIDISLVLGSGGARGLAHIGAINELTDAGYRIRSVSGCSIGALVGGMYAAGQLPAFTDWVKTLRSNEMMTLLDPTWGRGGFIKGERIVRRLESFVGDMSIEDLPISYTAVAADLSRTREVWINHGRLLDAIRASISLPLFFTPVKRGSSYLIDGGVLNPVPIAPTFRDPTDMTIAVNLAGTTERSPIEKDVDLDEDDGRVTHFDDEGFEAYIPNNPAMSLAEDSASLYDRFKGYVSRIQQSQKTEDTTDWGMYEIAAQAFDTMQSTIARQKLASYPPDMIIEIPRNACGTFEYNRAEELIELGRQRTRNAINLAPGR